MNKFITTIFVLALCSNAFASESTSAQPSESAAGPQYASFAEVITSFYPGDINTTVKTAMFQTSYPEVTLRFALIRNRTPNEYIPFTVNATVNGMAPNSASCSNPVYASEGGGTITYTANANPTNHYSWQFNIRIDNPYFIGERIDVIAERTASTF